MYVYCFRYIRLVNIMYYLNSYMNYLKLLNGKYCFGFLIFNNNNLINDYKWNSDINKRDI